MPLSALDAAAGIALGLAGLGILRRRRPIPGLLLLAAGALWLLGGPAGLVLAHRGPLTHLLLGYPRARLATLAERLVVVVAYGTAVVDPLARSAPITVAVGLVVVALASYRLRTSRGVERPARVTALLCTVLMWGVLVMGAGLRSFGAQVDGPVLVAYEIAVTVVAAVIFADLRFGRARRSAVAGLAVDLGRTAPRFLRDLLAETLADPSLVLAYVDTNSGQALDEAGRAVQVEDLPPGRDVTELQDDRGRRVAILVHDAAILADPVLVASVTSLAGVALTNLRLRAEVASRIHEVEASRRRLMSIADAERIRLEAETLTVQASLERATSLLAANGPDAAALTEQLAAGRDAVRDFARGLHPRILRDRGLSCAIHDLASRCPVPVAVSVPDERLSPEVESAAYFVCAEALTNIAKYARATNATLTVSWRRGELVIQIRDDGAGGANPSAGSGLTGLADRLDILDGPPRGGQPARCRDGGHGDHSSRRPMSWLVPSPGQRRRGW